MFLVFAIIAFYSIGGIWIWFYLGFGYAWFSWILKRTIGLFGSLDFDSVFLSTDLLHKDASNRKGIQEQLCPFFAVM